MSLLLLYNAQVGAYLSATEAQDTATISGAVKATGTLGATESPDTAAFAGNLTPTGTLAGTEAPDTAAMGGTITGGTIAGTLAATEAPDTPSALGSTLVPTGIWTKVPPPTGTGWTAAA